MKKVRPAIDTERFVRLLEEKALHPLPLASIIGEVRSDGPEIEIGLVFVGIEDVNEGFILSTVLKDLHSLITNQKMSNISRHDDLLLGLPSAKADDDGPWSFRRLKLR